MMGTIFCQYETPCGWCTRLDKECTEKSDSRKLTIELPVIPKLPAGKIPPKEEMLSPVGEYAAKFAENHGISFSEAMQHPTVKAYATAQSGLKNC